MSVFDIRFRCECGNELKATEQVFDGKSIYFKRCECSMSLKAHPEQIKMLKDLLKMNGALK